MAAPFRFLWLTPLLLVGGCSDRQEQSRAALQRQQMDFSVEDYFKAAREGKLDSITNFLDAGMAVDATDTDGSTALMIAAEAGFGHVVEELVRRGAQSGETRANGDTPLILAARSGNVVAVQVLLTAGSDPAMTNQENLTALAEAAMAGHASAVKLLAPVSRPSLDYSLQLAAVKGRTDVLDLLLQQGANVLARSSENRTPLMYAAKYGQEDAVRLLLQHNSNALALDNDLQTAAMLAESAGFASIAELLNDPKELPADPDEASTAPLPVLTKLHEQQFPAQSTAPLSQWLKFDSYRERQLPFILQEVSDDSSQATVQMLTREQEIVPLVKGTRLPQTHYVMVRAQHRLKAAKSGKGSLVDVSTLLVRDEVSGENVLAQFRQAVTAADSYGVLRDPASGTLYEVHPGDAFTVGTAHYKVLDVRPTQVLVEDREAKETMVLEK